MGDCWQQHLPCPVLRFLDALSCCLILVPADLAAPSSRRAADSRISIRCYVCSCLAEPLKLLAGGWSPRSWPADPNFRWHKVAKEANGNAAPKDGAEVRSWSRFEETSTCPAADIHAERVASLNGFTYSARHLRRAGNPCSACLSQITMAAFVRMRHHACAGKRHQLPSSAGRKQHAA